MRIFWNIQIIFWEIIIITVVEILCLKILTEELIIKLELNLLNLSWFIDLGLCTVFIKMTWLITSLTFIKMCWNNSSAKFIIKRVMLNGFQWSSNAEANNRWNKGFLINSLVMPFIINDIKCHIIITLI